MVNRLMSLLLIEMFRFIVSICIIVNRLLLLLVLVCDSFLSVMLFIVVNCIEFVVLNMISSMFFSIGVGCVDISVNFVIV